MIWSEPKQQWKEIEFLLTGVGRPRWVRPGQSGGEHLPGSIRQSCGGGDEEGHLAMQEARGDFWEGSLVEMGLEWGPGR